MNRAMLLLLAVCASGTAFAQEEGKRDPVKPQPGSAVSYRSAFEDYRPYREQELAAWREVNEAVARVGGHVGVMKAAQEKPAGEKR